MSAPPPDAVAALARDLAGILPPGRLVIDPLRRLAWGTDASFYRLVPALVVTVQTEDEVRGVLAACRRHAAPVTFRAAGTSLSGQAVTDSVLMVLGDGWDRVVVERDGAAIRLQPGVVGAAANRRLAAFARRIGPDPASIDAARIGGIAANNASGMCCGTADNSYQTLAAMRLILADGSLVDTGDAASVAAFRTSHAGLLAGLAELGRRARGDAGLAERIRAKFAIKNTTGYGLNALVDFDDPVEILQHLMVGSEGTLGFIAEITYRTVPEPAHKASALLLFPDIAAACRAVAALKGLPASAAELMDRAALRSVENQPGLPDGLSALPDGAAALLVETRGDTAAALAANVAALGGTLAGQALLAPPAFTADPAEYGRLWKVRKGLLPAVGAVRVPGTTVIIEDVAVRTEHLAAATLDLQALLATHGYAGAIIFGHALDGNLHFVFTQDFGDDAEVARYAALMDDLCRLVVGRYDGSLKAEHGTGRNMAPFVEREWGAAATGLMWEIKRLLDPDGLLNPGVVLDANPRAHLENLKPLPAADPLVDTCMECGFCERMCPSHGMTLSPRQRIVGWREIMRLKATGGDSGGLEAAYVTQGLDTCAACGLCATACPVGIETGLLVKALRGRRMGVAGRVLGRWAAAHTGGLLATARAGLAAAAMAERLSGGHLPKFGRPALPGPARQPPVTVAAGDGPAVVYVPSCASRLMGPAPADPERDSLPRRFAALLTKAGFRVVWPDGLAGLCCGQAWESKGLAEIADAKAGEMVAALLAASDNGRLPVVMDASACTLRLKGRLAVLDSIEFLHDTVLPRLDITRQQAPVLLHVTCAARRMGLADKMVALARACAETVVVPDGVGCCGFAGDKGFTTPDLNAFALRHLKQAVPEGCDAGYSSNRTCEIGLAEHGGIPYRSIVTLLDRVSRRRE